MCYGAGAGRGSLIHCASMVPQSSALLLIGLSQPDFDITLARSALAASGASITGVTLEQGKIVVSVEPR